jgi:hypothetical protein
LGRLALLIGHDPKNHVVSKGLDMPISQTRLVPSQGPQDFTIHCVDHEGDRVSVRVPYTVIDKLEPSGNYSYGSRLERHSGVVMDVARRAYGEGQIRNKMIYLCANDFDRAHGWKPAL